MNQINEQWINENGTDLDKVVQELKRVASVKSRLKKQLGKAENKAKLQEVVQYEEVLKGLRDSLTNRKKYVTEYTWEDISQLSYEEVNKAINSIKSKKSLSRWLTEVEGDNDEYRQAVEVEALLYTRKEQLGGNKKQHMKESLRSILDNQADMTKEELVEALQKLLD